MVKKFFYLFIIILFYAQNAQASVHHPQTADSAKGFIEDLGRRAIASLTKPGAPKNELESSFRSLLEEGFDVPAIGRLVLGHYWKQMTPNQESRFIDLFKNRLVKSYANRFQEYAGVHFIVTGERPEGEHVIVTSTIQKPGGPITPVDWRVEGGKIHDVKVEGVSMSVTMQADYRNSIQRNGNNIDKFLDELGGSSTGGSGKRPKAANSDDD